MRIAINGVGRIGKLVARFMLERGDDFELVALNDKLGDPQQHALLLEFDSVHGRWDRSVGFDDNHVVLDGRSIPVTRHDHIEDWDLKSLGVDLVLDCTGKFKSEELVAPYYKAGVSKVLVSAPIKTDNALNLVYGVNHHLYQPDQHHLITAASCTTNCLAPVVKVIHEEFGIRHGSITTIHDITNTQTIIDRPAKDSRRARAALSSMIPTTTGSATAITVIYPELKGRLNGHAVRVPLLNASLTDCVFEVERPTNVKEVNEKLAHHAANGLQGILGYEERPLVSADYLNDPRSSIIDAGSTMVVNETQVKIYAWYDNEFGYAKRMVDIAAMIQDAA